MVVSIKEYILIGRFYGLFRFYKIEINHAGYTNYFCLIAEWLPHKKDTLVFQTLQLEEDISC